MKINSLVKLSLISSLIFLTFPAFAQTESSTTSTDTNVIAQTPADDTAITNTIQKAIHSSKALSKLKVNVSTKNGVVTIQGDVASDTQASSLIELAESVVGVADVDSAKLNVKESKEPFADLVITAKIRGLLIREKLFGEKDVASLSTNVETTDGTVYLSGVTDNKAQIDNAIDIIKKNIPEVKKVEYKVSTVNPS
jgi:hyperosmotically inducible protein